MRPVFTYLLVDMQEQQPYNNGTSQQAPQKKLYKSRRDKMIDGVCGGIAEYFEVDPTLIRILWVIITIAGGSGIFLYIAAMIIMPANPNHGVIPEPVSNSRSGFDHKRFWGILFILLGAFLLTTNLGIIGNFSWWWFSWKLLFPIIIITAGITLIIVEMNKHRSRTARQDFGSGTDEQVPPPRKRELRRSVHDKKIVGVCGGLAEYFGIDSTLVRIIYLAVIFASFGWGLLLYIILALLMPEDKFTT